MTDRADPSREAGWPDDGTPVEAYETDGVVVLYDSGNPLAWIESTRTVRVDEAT